MEDKTFKEAIQQATQRITENMKQDIARAIPQYLSGKTVKEITESIENEDMRKILHNILLTIFIQTFLTENSQGSELPNDTQRSEMIDYLWDIGYPA